MSVSLTPPMFLQFFVPGTNQPAVGYQLFTYIAGTSTKQATWTDSTQVTQSANPLIADANGVVIFWVDPTLSYKYVLAAKGDTDPPTSPIYSVDNIQGFFTLATLTQGLIGSILYPRTAAEIAAGVTPTNYAYAPGIVDRYGTNTTPGTTDMTTAVNHAVAVAMAGISNGGSGVVQFLAAQYAVASSITVTFSGTRSTESLQIFGAGPNAANIYQTGTPSALFTFIGSTPSANPTEAQLVIRDLTLAQPSKTQTADGIVLNSLANIRLSNIIVRGFASALHIKSSLIITANNGCQFTDSINGCLIESNGVGGSTCNLIVIEECKLNLNTNWGLNFTNGSQLHLRSNDVEGNGTSNNVNTGAIRIQGALAPDSLVAGVLLDANWLESNVGSGILVDAPTGGVQTDIVIRGGNVLAQEAGRSITVNGATRLRIEDVVCATPGDTFNLTASQGILENTLCTTLTDGGITSPTYINVTTSSGFYAAGRVDTSVTLTLTGVSGSVTQNPKIVQQGDVIRVVFTDMLGVSNTTSCTITGLPAKYAPAVTVMTAAIVENNSGDSPQVVLIQSGGTITLTINDLAAGFTASGTKGLRACNLEWRL